MKRPRRALGPPCTGFRGGNAGNVVSGPFWSPAPDPPPSLGRSGPPRSPEPPRSHRSAPDAGCTRWKPETRAIPATNEDAKPPSSSTLRPNPRARRDTHARRRALGPDVPAGRWACLRRRQRPPDVSRCLHLNRLAGERYGGASPATPEPALTNVWGCGRRRAAVAVGPGRRAVVRASRYKACLQQHQQQQRQ